MYSKTYFRLEKLTIEKVLPFIRSVYENEEGFRVKPTMHVTESNSVNVFSVRLRTFKNNTKCVSCGIKGEYFYAERQHNGNTKRFHLNMYGIDESGHEVLMTKDHIIPKSKGGSDNIGNMQTMCITCNQAKGNGEEKAIFCPHPKLGRNKIRRRWDIQPNDSVCKSSRKKFQSNNRVEKVIGFTSSTFSNICIKQALLTNCDQPVPLLSINNDPKEVKLLTKRDIENPL